MRMSTIPEKSSSLEPSEELITALAEGRWWAIMEVSHPISEEPEYEDFISGQWWGGMGTEETSSPLIFNDASEKTESLHFSDVTLKTTEQWRQKKTPVSAGLKKEGLIGSLISRDGSEKAEPLRSCFTGAPLMTTEHQRLRRQKKQKGAPVAAGSKRAQWRDLTSFTVFSNPSEKTESPNSGFSDAPLKKQQRKRRQREPQGAPVPACSSQGAPGSTGSPSGPPVTTGSRQRGKLWIPDHLRQHLQKAALELGTSVPAVSSLKRTVVPQQQQQQKPQASLPKGPPVSAGSQLRGKLRLPENLRYYLQKAALELGTSVPAVSSPKTNPSHQASTHSTCSCLKGAWISPTYTTHALQGPGKKIPEPVGQELPQEKPPLPAKSPQEQRCPQQQEAAAAPTVASLAPVPVFWTQSAPTSTRVLKDLPTGFPQQDAHYSVVLKQQRQKWRERHLSRRREQKTPKPSQGAEKERWTVPVWTSLLHRKIST